MVLNGNAQENLLDAYTELKLLTFQDKFSSIEKPIKSVESTHSNTRLATIQLRTAKRYLNHPRKHGISVTCPI